MVLIEHMDETLDHERKGNSLPYSGLSSESVLNLVGPKISMAIISGILLATTSKVPRVIMSKISIAITPRT